MKELLRGVAGVKRGGKHRFWRLCLVVIHAKDSTTKLTNLNLYKYVNGTHFFYNNYISLHANYTSTLLSVTVRLGSVSASDWFPIPILIGAQVPVLRMVGPLTWSDVFRHWRVTPWRSVKNTLITSQKKIDRKN